MPDKTTDVNHWTSLHARSYKRIGHRRRCTIEAERQYLRDHPEATSLPPGYVAHHLSGDIRDDTPRNLTYLTRREHIYEHLPVMHEAKRLWREVARGYGYRLDDRSPARQAWANIVRNTARVTCGVAPHATLAEDIACLPEFPSGRFDHVAGVVERLIRKRAIALARVNDDTLETWAAD